MATVCPRQLTRHHTRALARVGIEQLNLADPLLALILDAVYTGHAKAVRQAQHRHALPGIALADVSIAWRPGKGFLDHAPL